MNRSRVTGDLASHGNIFVDIANDRVGIGSTIPGEKLSLPDSAKIALGNSADLKIYHDGSHSLLKNSTGYLRLSADGSGVTINNGDNSETMATFVKNGSVELYHDNTKTFSTNSLGISVYQRLVCEGTAPSILFSDTNHQSYTITADANALTITDANNGNRLGFNANGSISAYGFFNCNNSVYAANGFSTNGNIDIDDDGDKLRIGAGDDLQIYHSTFNYIESYNDAEIHINANTGGSVENMAKFKPNGAVELYHNGGQIFRTESAGIVVSGNVRVPFDSHKILLGASQDLQIYHDGSHSYIDDVGTGNLKVRSNNFRVSNADESKISATFVPSGAVELYHNHSKKLETTSSGVTVTGTLAATAVTGDGSALTGITQTTINNNANNRVITGSGTANTLEGESKLTFDGTNLRLDHGDTVDGFMGEAYSGYFGLKHTDQTLNTEYMILSQNSHTFISATSGHSVYIRGGGNSSTNQMIVSTSGTTIGGNLVLTTANEGSGNGLDADTLDGVQGSSYLRSDANDTASGQITLTSSSQYPLIINSSHDGKIVVQGSSSPYIRFQNGSTNSAYIQSHSNGNLYIVNQSTGEQLLIGSGSNGLTYVHDNTTSYVWHAGNDGTGSGLDADLLDGIDSTAFIRTSGSSIVVASDGNNYPRITHNQGSAQLGLFRGTNSVGGMYIGADVNSFRIWTDNFTARLTLTQAGSVSTTVQGTLWGASNDGSGSGLDADTLDGVQGSSFLRSDADDTMSEKLTFTQNGQTEFLKTPGNVTMHSVGSADGRLVLRNLSELRFENGSNWNYNEWAGIKFNTSTDVMYIGGPASNNFTNNGGAANIDVDFVGLNGSGLKKDGNTVWHAGNDGSGSGLDADTCDGQHLGSSANVNFNTITLAGNNAIARAQTLRYRDLRNVAPADESANSLRFYFTSWGNSGNSSGYADGLHLRSYGDSSGGSDNLVVWYKNGFGMRQFQQSWGSSTDYSNYAQYFHGQSHAIPQQDNTFDLGSTTYRWRNILSEQLNVTKSSGNLSGTFVAENGLGTLEIGGSTGAFIDLKMPSSDDFDFRLGTSGSGGYMNVPSGQAISVTGHFNPAGNNAYDLGTTSLRWRNLYTNDLNLSNEGSTNDVDGTWGSYTIQEGEDDLFLINKRNGKKYKFNLTEVS